MFVLYNMLAVHVLRLELGLIIISHVITGLTGGASGVPQADIFWHFVGEGHRGFLEDVRVVILDKLYENGRQRKVSGNKSWILSLPGVLISGR